LATQRHDENERQLAVQVLRQSTSAEQTILLDWARKLLEIRNSKLSVFQKAKRSILITLESKAIWPLIKQVGNELKR